MKDAEVVKTEASFFAPKRKEVMPMNVLLSNFFIIIAQKNVKIYYERTIIKQGGREKRLIGSKRSFYGFTATRSMKSTMMRSEYLTCREARRIKGKTQRGKAAGMYGSSHGLCLTIRKRQNTQRKNRKNLRKG